MSDKAIRIIKVLAGITIVLLLVYTYFSPRWAARPEDVRVPAPTAIPTPVPTPEITPTQEVTATPEPTATPAPSPTPEPTPEYFTISMVGDCTLASYPEIQGRDSSFENVVQTNWEYPFTNTRSLFEADEMTIVNLECSISDLTGWAGTTFSFLASADAVNILTDGNVEFATTSNNHAKDFGQEIYGDTAANLTSAGIGNCGDGEGALYTTENGLIIGVYATFNGHYPDANTVAEGVRSLKNQGAEIVVVSAHWGDEASYYVNDNQKTVAHAAIDAGADVVFGHGPHRVEPYEEYGAGIIFYSLGNFIFGGNTNPNDMDCIIAQATFCREVDGAIHYSGFKAIPASISSRSDINDYCPTVFDEGTEDYDRCMSKADGSFNGYNDVIDYSFMHTDEE